MSSFRGKHNNSHHVTRENKCFRGPRPNRNVQGLLRLNSTGEVTSDHEVRNCQNPAFDHDSLNGKDNQRYTQNCYNNFVENLKMGSLINSASAYIGSATSYFGNLCPYNTSKGLTRSKSDNSSLSYLKNMFSGVRQTHRHRAESLPDLDANYLTHSCKCAKPELSEDLGKSMNWTGSIFGALQCSLLSNCPSKSEKMKGINVEKYVPPQRRYNQEKTCQVSPVIDPKLTPYNAKLLEKSRRIQSHSNVKKDLVSKVHPQQAHKGKDVAKPENILEKDCKEKANICSPVQETVPGSCVSRNFENERKELKEETETANSEKETDWFDYECDNFKSIPISMEKIQLASLKSAESDDTQESSQKCAEIDDIQNANLKSKQLHSWFSVESSNETVNSDSSQDKETANFCDKTLNCLKEDSVQIAEKLSSDEDDCTETKKMQHSKHEQHFSTKCKSKLQDKDESDHSSADNNNYVLYVRSLGRRGRPSAKKRRRQKAQQNENGEQSKASSDKTTSELKPDSAFNPSSAVAFILGYGADGSENDTHSFHVSCDIEADSDWSESDLESDENFSSLEDETLFENGLGFQCNDPLGMQCFTVTCLVQPSEDSIVTPNSSAIDNINLSWRVQVSVEPESRKKKSSTSKKVHFPDDNDLSIVHPMVTWSYAYQAARKGPWVQYACDRERFLRRIADVETLLKPVLDKGHRDRIFRERFSEE